MTTREFQTMIWRFYRTRGRHDLPWRHTKDPYRILVSEVMLQQTQVPRVQPKYRQFLRAFPTLQALDRAPLAAVLAAWQGLGYNRRALAIKKLARIVARDLGGKIPSDPEALQQLPGVGRATAGAIAAFAFNRPSVFLETNIRRTYLHHFFPGQKWVNDEAILERIQKTLPRGRVREWYWALMDYGALALRAIENPNRASGRYARQSAFVGSRRQARGRILAEVVRKHTLPYHTFRALAATDTVLKQHPFKNLITIVKQLSDEGFIEIRNQKLILRA